MEPDEFRRVRELFFLAESKLKGNEHLNDELLVPALNELRYAGYHLITAITTPDSIERTDHIVKAENHCMRACYDVLDVRIAYYLKEIYVFKGDYTNVVIGDVLFDYQDQLKDTRAAQEFLLQNSIHTVDKKVLETAEKHCDRLMNISYQQETARDELNKKMEISSTKALNATRVLIVGIITLIVTAIGVIFTILANFKNC